MPHLPLDLLVIDPAAAVRAWLASLTEESGDWPDVTLPALGWLSTILSGVELENGRLTSRVGGLGTYEEPWTVPLGAGPGAPEVLVWLDPPGPALAGTPGLMEYLVPGELSDALEGATPLPRQRVSSLLERAHALARAP